MIDADYPALYQSADESSVDAQHAYLRIVRIEYALLVIATALALGFGQGRNFHIAYALAVLMSSAALLYMAVKKPERDWYNCRALAESIKTATWRYVMGAEPFGRDLNPHDARAKFAAFLRDILATNTHVQDTLSRRPKAGDQISIRMDEIRALAIVERKALYRAKRIRDQRDWYVRKADSNRRQFRLWIGACIVLQVAAIASALLRIEYDQQLLVWPTDVLLVMVSSIIGWIQTKKFSELAPAYSLAAHEIGLVDSRIDHPMSEAEFSAFVNEAERAFSREHTQWTARQST